MLPLRLSQLIPHLSILLPELVDRKFEVVVLIEVEHRQVLVIIARRGIVMGCGCRREAAVVLETLFLDYLPEDLGLVVGEEETRLELCRVKAAFGTLLSNWSLVSGGTSRLASLMIRTYRFLS